MGLGLCRNVVEATGAVTLVTDTIGLVLLHGNGVRDTCDETYGVGVAVCEVVVKPWRFCTCGLGLTQGNPMPVGALHVAVVGTTGVWKSAITEFW